MKRVAIYIRVSSDEQSKEGISLDAQRKKLEDYASSNGWYVFRVYEDRGVSAKIPIKKRPEGKKMFDDIKKEKFSAILLFKLDRAFRNTLDAILTSDELRVNNVDLISISEQIDTTTAMGKFFFTLMSALAQLERELTSERLDLTSNYKFEKGIMIGKIPLGYYPIFQNKKERKNVIDIKINQKEAEVVKDIFNLTYQGKNWRDICAKHGIKHYQSYKDIITNKVYIGIISYHGKELKGIHEPIISEELFNKINKN